MLQCMTSVLSSSDPNLSSDISEIEQFRARRRLLCRGQTTAMSPTENEEPIVEDGRMRKFSATWQQKQQLEQCHRQYDHAIWPRSAGIEMCMGYNAFDFSASPEVFYDEPIEPIVTKDYAAQAKQQDIGEVQELHMTDMTKRQRLWASTAQVCGIECFLNFATLKEQTR
ncbi:unnamed protein product [Peronospora belbahrii]|uniref:Uncharacterized protein n=1 Tax=Peronospora belbahrii TaxID=622444 RepID=A0ABN8CVZ2_9STRA|nr:unnamed protein product [Peronospora belbahrii]